MLLEVLACGWGFSNRGYLFGPWLPIYGTGALIFILLFGKIRKRKIYVGSFNVTPLLLFLGTGLIATAIELVASYLLEWKTGGWMWDYSKCIGNFQSRIALTPSLGFGLGGLLLLLVVHPRMEAITYHIPAHRRLEIGAVLLVLMAIDVLTILK